MGIRVLIADDHGVLRAGLRALLHGAADIRVVAEADTGQEAVQLAGRLRPDIILLDISMPGIDGIEVTRRLSAARAETRVLIMTMHEDTSLLRAALDAGAAGYIIKRAVESELITAIHAVYRGELYIHPALTRGLFQDPPLASPVPAAEGLTAREIDVLRRIGQGHTNREIAEALTLSVRTVESHRASILSKLGMHSRAELARYAAQHGLLDLSI
jgi:two-component system, NarL family, response regulator NreC